MERNYIFPFEKERNFMRYFSYIVSKSQVHHGSTCHSAPFCCTHPPWTERRIFSMENVREIVCKNLFYRRVFNPIPGVSDWYICCVCVLLISFSNQVAEKHKTPFITRIVLRLWSKFCEGLELCCSSSILYNTTSMECYYSICFSEVCCWTSAENMFLLNVAICILQC